MIWKFHILAAAERRLLSRILQILENQMANIVSFTGEVTSDGISVTFVCSFEDDRTYRVEALLYRLQGISTVSITPQSARQDCWEPSDGALVHVRESMEF